MRSLLTAPRSITLAGDLPAGAMARTGALGRYATVPALGRYATVRSRAGLGQLWDFYIPELADNGSYGSFYGFEDGGGGGGDYYGGEDLFLTDSFYGGELQAPDPWDSFWDAWSPGETVYVESDPYAFDPFQTQDVPFETQFIEPGSLQDNDQFWQDFAAGGVPTYGYINWNGEDLLFDLSDPAQTEQYNAIANFQMGMPGGADFTPIPTTNVPLSTQLQPPDTGNWFTNALKAVGNALKNVKMSAGGGSSGGAAGGGSAKPAAAPAKPLPPGAKPPSWFEQSMIGGIPNWVLLVAGGGVLLLRRK